MERSKTIALMTEIFNKLSSKSFISKTCGKHPTLIPLLLCKGCVNQSGETFCEQCFKDHNCGDKSKKQITQWVSSHQQMIGKYINNVQREFETSRQSLQSGQIRIQTKRHLNQQTNQQKTITELNNQIVMAISRSIQKCQKQIQENCIKPLIQGPLKTLFQNFISGVKLEINKLSGNLSQINTLTQNCEKNSRLAQKQIQDQLIDIRQNCSVFYQRSVKRSVQQVLNKIWISKDDKQNCIGKSNSQDSSLLQYQVSQLQKQNSILKQMQFDLQNQISKLKQSLKIEYQNNKLKQKEHIQAVKKSQQQNEKLRETSRKQQQNWKKYENQIRQIQQKNNKIKKLQNKCQQYQQQLAELARNQVSPYQKPEQRYDMEDAAHRIYQLSQKCHHLIIQGNSKDRKITQLIAEINKMKLRNRENKSPINSARKQST